MMLGSGTEEPPGRPGLLHPLRLLRADARHRRLLLAVHEGHVRVLLGRNQIPWWLSGVSFYMTSFSDVPVRGLLRSRLPIRLVAVTLGWTVVPAVLIGAMFFASRWRRARIDSPVEYLEERYSLGLRQTFGWANIPVRMIDNGLRLYATGLFISGVTGIPVTDSIYYCGLITLAYTFAGGLWAVTVTDFVQFVVMMAGVIILVPLSLVRDRRVERFRQQLAAEGSSSSLRSRPSTRGPSWLPGSCSCCATTTPASASSSGTTACGTSVKRGRSGYFVALLILVGTPIFFLPAMAARQFLPDAGPQEHLRRSCARRCCLREPGTDHRRDVLGDDVLAVRRLQRRGRGPDQRRLQATCRPQGHRTRGWSWWAG